MFLIRLRHQRNFNQNNACFCCNLIWAVFRAETLLLFGFPIQLKFIVAFLKGSFIKVQVQ